MSIYYNQFINEVYFGNNSNIKAMQQCITNFRKELFENTFSLNFKLSDHPEILKFDRLAEKEFGFDKFFLKIDPQMVRNAYTLTLSFNDKMLNQAAQPNDFLIVTNKGYKFKPEAKYKAYVCVFLGIMANKDFTDRDVMAVILHEIGHNFQAAISKQCSLATFTYNVVIIGGLLGLCIAKGDVLSAAYLIYMTHYRRDFLVGLHKAGMEYFEPFYDAAYTVKKFLSYISYPIDKLITIVLSPLILIGPKMINLTQIFLSLLRRDYANENLADNFATIYGYGVETARCETLFQGDEIFNKIEIPILSPLLGFSNATLLFILTIFDEHPYGVSRVKNQAEYLEKELEKDDAIDAETKRELKKQIDEIYKQLDELTDVKGNIHNYALFDKIYQKLLLVTFGGDPRNKLLSYKDIHADIEKVYSEKITNEDVIMAKLKNMRLL